MSLLSGVITITTAGTAEAGPDTGTGTFMILPDPANTGAYCYVGNDGADDVSSTTGLKLAAHDPAIFTGNLNTVYFDVTTSGDKLTWLKTSS